MTKTFIFMRCGRLYEIHLPNLKWSIRQFKLSRGSENGAVRTIWVIFWIGGTSEVVFFHGLINISHQY